MSEEKYRVIGENLVQQKINSSITSFNERVTAVETSLAACVKSGEYNSTSKKIVLKNGDGTSVAEIDASAFVIDGMVENVSVVDGNLVITFNTDSGKTPISIPITDIFDSSNYYSRTESDGRFVQQVSGKSLSTNDYTNEDKNKLDGIEANANNYTLPVASANTLGGVKVGSRLSVASDGTLSANEQPCDVTSVNTKTGAVVLKGTDIAVSSTDDTTITEALAEKRDYTDLTYNVKGEPTSTNSGWFVVNEQTLEWDTTSSYWTDGNWVIFSSTNGYILEIDGGDYFAEFSISSSTNYTASVELNGNTYTIIGYVPDTLAKVTEVPSVDSVPTSGSTNAVSSGGVYTALGAKLSLSGGTLTGELTTTNITVSNGYSIIFGTNSAHASSSEIYFNSEDRETYLYDGETEESTTFGNIVSTANGGNLTYLRYALGSTITATATLADRTMNLVVPTSDNETDITLTFPDAVSGYARDFTILVTNTSGNAGSISFTTPTGATIYGDGFTECASGSTMLYSVTEVASNTFYVRAIEMEEVA